ncbi:MAG: Smr/MutS family protein [Haliscomenobacter sp.]|nr:Smr/MutS family protein [Haliscomenobacter sp.]
MRLEPKDLFQRLEFDKVLLLVEQECQGELGKAAALLIKPGAGLERIEAKLTETREMRRAIEYNDRIHIPPYADLQEDLQLLEIQDYVLPEDGLRRLNVSLVAVAGIYDFFTDTRREVYPSMYNIIRQVHFDKTLILEIDRDIDPEGNIRANASSELERIRKALQGKQRELDKVFREVIQTYRTKGWLSENVESFRNGRRVLSVPAEHKRKVRGIIHDESATGRTAFIEPEPIIPINNDIFDLEQEERREVFRILKTLSALLRPYVPQIRKYQDLLVYFDVLQAKGRVGLMMKAGQPQIQQKPVVQILDGRHPLLFLRNSPLGKPTIPFTLRMEHENRILVLSGPNAGGKSITMKSVGLFQLMVQSGLLIPADERSVFGIFSNIFADIGDQQSIEDDLSTYSSHLNNMRQFVEEANERTLILIDEFGSGTDPQMGGAIAESVLRELNFKKVFGVVTTHYSNLKIFAFKSKGILNGAMHFDKDHLLPTYELKVGRPGSSYAFEIAIKNGLDPKILEYARNRSGKSETAVDQLLIDLQKEKQELEEQLAQMKDREEKLERLMKSYEQMHRDMEFRRKRQKLEAKELALQQVSRDNQAFEKLIRELREANNLEKAKELAALKKEERQQLQVQVVELKEEVYLIPEKKRKELDIKAGDHVKLIQGGAIGKVEALKKDKAVVLVGQMRMTIHTRDLQPANEPLSVQQTKSIQTDMIHKSAGFQSKLDIRGMRLEEALKIVEEFVDQALLISANNLRIVHGKGNGVLRKAVRMKLKEYSLPMAISHPEPELGGDGVTLVEIQ